MKMLIGAVAGVVLTSSVAAANETLQTVISDTERGESVWTTSSTKTLSAEDYGLTENDLIRYYQVMEGPYGRWYRDLDPAWVLGFAAETDAERDRYAEIVADMEHARVERELAFQRAYDRVWKARGEAYPIIDQSRWDDVADLQSMIKTASRQAAAGVPVTRLALYVQHDCACDVSSPLQRAKGRAVDIFVVGAQDDEAIRSWAMAQNIPVDQVRTRRITLNHDEGVFDALVDTDDLMVLFENTSEGYKRWE